MPNVAIALAERHTQLEDRALSQCPSNQGRVQMPSLQQDGKFDDGAEHMENHAPIAVDSECGEVAKVLYDIDTAPSGVSVNCSAVSSEPIVETEYPIYGCRLCCSTIHTVLAIRLFGENPDESDAFQNRVTKTQIVARVV